MFYICPDTLKKRELQLTNPTRINRQPQQTAGKQHALRNIIDHDTQTAVHLLIQPFNRLWLENIEKPEQDKTAVMVCQVLGTSHIVIKKSAISSQTMPPKSCSPSYSTTIPHSSEPDMILEAVKELSIRSEKICFFSPALSKNNWLRIPLSLA